MQSLRKVPPLKDLVTAYYEKTNVYLAPRPYLRTLNSFPIQSLIGNHEALMIAAEKEAAKQTETNQYQQSCARIWT
jgi:hypothetical protein